jgi:hypothetical protein
MNKTTETNTTNEAPNEKPSGEENWLLTFPGVNVAGGTGKTDAPAGDKKQLDDTAFMNDMAQRESFLEQVRVELQKIERDLKGAFEFKIKTREGETLPALAESGTSLDEADRTEWEGQIPEENRKKIEAARASIEKISAIMLEQKSAETGELLFTRDEVAEAIWTPLVRKRIIPETVVPTDYSQVAAMVERTNELYNQRVEQLKETGKLTPPTSLGKVGTVLAKGVIDIVTAGAKGAGPDGAKELDKETVTRIGDITKVASATVDAVDGIIDLPSGASARKVGTTVAKGVIKVVAAGAGAAGPDRLVEMDKETATLIGNICTVASTTVAGVDKIIDQVGDGKWQEVISTSLSLVSDLVGSKLAGALIGEKYSKETTSMIVKCVQKSCTALDLTNDFVAAANNNGKGFGDALRKALGFALSTGIGCAYGDALGKVIAEKCPKCKLNSDKEFEGDDYLDSIAEWVVECINSTVKLIDSSGAKVNESALAEKFSQDQMKDEIRLREETNFFLSAADASSIEKLIAKIEKDRAVFDTAMKIAAGGIDLAAKLFAPLAMASLGLEFIKSCKEALNRFIEIKKWLGAQESLAKAQSPLVSSAYNQVKNLGAQLAKHSTDAVIKAVQLVGNAMQLAAGTPVAAAGVIVESSAKAAAAAANTGFKLYTMAELERGWKATSAALLDPENRRLALKARADNPSLAKYSIAWGALEKGDPFARSLMGKIGLTEASLENRDTDVHKVVKYLETLYNEDSKLYRECAAVIDGIPVSPELTPESWQQIINACKGAKEFLVVPSPDSVPQIKAALIALDSIPRDRDATAWVAFHKRLGEKASGRFNEFALDRAAERVPEKIEKIYAQITIDLKKMVETSERVASLAAQVGKYLNGLATVEVKNNNTKNPHTTSQMEAARKNLSKYFSSLAGEAQGISKLFEERTSEIKNTIKNIRQKQTDLPKES